MSSEKKQDYEALSNEELVKLSQCGDQNALGVLCASFFKNGILHTKVGYLDSDDIIQEGLIGLLKAVDTYDFSRGVPFSAYACVCIRNNVISATGSDVVEIPVGIGSEVPVATDVVEDPLKKVIVGERLNDVLNACDTTLSVAEKTVVFLKAGGLSYDEIGERLKMSPKSVDNALQRARKKLKKVCSDDDSQNT